MLPALRPAIPAFAVPPLVEMAPTDVLPVVEVIAILPPLPLALPVVVSAPALVVTLSPLSVMLPAEPPKPVPVAAPVRALIAREEIASAEETRETMPALPPA